MKEPAGRSVSTFSRSRVRAQFESYSSALSRCLSQMQIYALDVLEIDMEYFENTP